MSTEKETGEKAPFDLQKTISDLVALFKENFQLRTLFDFNMDMYVRFLELFNNEEILEKGLDLGRRLIDELIYNIF